jgi:dethiobiotin synthetase
MTLPAAGTGLTGTVLVTGTDTGVGKTIVTAAIAASALASGLRVAVVKPGQTGVAEHGSEQPQRERTDDEMSDVEIITRLAAPTTAVTLAEYPDPLAPFTAARVARLAPLDLFTVIDEIKAVASSHDLTLVEGAGGLLVPMGLRPGGDPWTVADLAVCLGAPAVLVTRAGLGTLNHTALTLEALERRGIAGHLVLGAWPSRPELVHLTNLADLPPELHGLLPAGAGAMDPGVFRRSAPGWLTPTLYGTCDYPQLLADTDED